MLKIAKVVPVFKSGSTEDMGNYRPISILPCFSKILERVMYNRNFNFLTKHNILSVNQFGFQANYSTHLVIYQGFCESKFTLGIFIDLSKTFDTVSHAILIIMLENYGIREKYLCWFKNYLDSRKQFISYEDNENSNLELILCGVPHGSIHGPLLFLINIIDICKLIYVYLYI